MGILMKMYVSAAVLFLLLASTAQAFPWGKRNCPWFLRQIVNQSLEVEKLEPLRATEPVPMKLTSASPEATTTVPKWLYEPASVDKLFDHAATLKPGEIELIVLSKETFGLLIDGRIHVLELEGTQSGDVLKLGNEEIKRGENENQFSVAMHLSTDRALEYLLTPPGFLYMLLHRPKFKAAKVTLSESQFNKLNDRLRGDSNIEVSVEDFRTVHPVGTRRVIGGVNRAWPIGMAASLTYIVVLIKALSGN